MIENLKILASLVLIVKTVCFISSNNDAVADPEGGCGVAQISETGLRPPRRPTCSLQSLSTVHTCCAGCSVLSSGQAIVDICCVRQQTF